MAFQFEWDPVKAILNKKRHGISFEQATTVFDDLGALEGYDETHSQREDRFTRIGMSDSGVLVVVFTERESRIIRLITARRANREEEKHYYEYQTH